MSNREYGQSTIPQLREFPAQDFKFRDFPGLLSPPFVALDDATLSDPNFIFDAANALARKGLSRREVPLWILDTLWAKRNELTDACGERFEFTTETAEEVFGDEGSYRWISGFLAFPLRPWRQRAQSQILPRLRLIALALGVDPPIYQDHIVCIGYALNGRDYYRRHGLRDALENVDDLDVQEKTLRAWAETDRRELNRVIASPIYDREWLRLLTELRIREIELLPTGQPIFRPQSSSVQTDGGKNDIQARL